MRPLLTLGVMLAVLEVWQAILVKKLDLDSSWVKQSMSEGARQLLKVHKPHGSPPITGLIGNIYVFQCIYIYYICAS